MRVRLTRRGLYVHIRQPVFIDRKTFYRLADAAMPWRERAYGGCIREERFFLWRTDDGAICRQPGPISLPNCQSSALRLRAAPGSTGSVILPWHLPSTRSRRRGTRSAFRADEHAPTELAASCGFAAEPGNEARFRHDFERALRYAEAR